MNMGAFFSMSGTMTKRTRLPRMKMCSTCDTLPSRPVAVTFASCTFQLSSASCSSPRYISPLFNSTCRAESAQVGTGDGQGAVKMANPITLAAAATPTAGAP